MWDLGILRTDRLLRLYVIIWHCGGGSRMPRQPPRIRPGSTGQDSAVHATDSGPLSNKLLAALPRKDFEFLLPHLEAVQIARGTVLCEPGSEVDQVYFPLSGMISMVVVMRDGKAIETATVGREGVVGAMAGLGRHILQVRVIAQLPMSARRIT